MSITLQVVLIIMTVLLFITLTRNVKKGKLRTDYALGWIVCSISLIIISIFPQIVYFCARIIGVMSASNMIFAIIIFLLIILVYMLFSKVSLLEEKQKDLIQELGILKESNNLENNGKIRKYE
ncbi:DUF2304 domain-containing protein [Thomasclavelia ramosa]|uniref:DUF2304 domain-containing protein n=1 Tax=Thomasclavelia ramosa TaxID=1547 RepID=UPI0032C0AED4